MGVLSKLCLLPRFIVLNILFRELNCRFYSLKFQSTCMFFPLKQYVTVVVVPNANAASKWRSSKLSMKRSVK